MSEDQTPQIRAALHRATEYAAGAAFEQIGCGLAESVDGAAAPAMSEALARLPFAVRVLAGEGWEGVGEGNWFRSYTSRKTRPTNWKLGTFSYLPETDAARARKQIEYIIEQDWNPVIEHVETNRATEHYWYIWRSSFFGERSVDAIFTEITTCRKEFPGHYVRIVGYDNGRQTQGARIVVYHGDRRTN